MDKQLSEMASVFQALADPTRLRILGLLLTGEVCVCHIHETLKISQPKASRHLAYLRRAGLVRGRREGLWIHYSLSLPGAALAAVVTEATERALLRADAVQKDLVRLQKKTGCCLPASDGTATADCQTCAPKRQRKTAKA